MIEVLELRVLEEFAGRIFRPDEGKKLGSGLIRLVKVPTDDPRLCKVPMLRELIRAECGRAFFHGWELKREYSAGETRAASLFRLRVTSTFEPAGEECGTEYDESTACPRCGAGARQISPLFVDVNRIPRGKDISRTISGEIVVSRRVKELFERHQITGANLVSVRSNPSSSAESSDWFQLIVEDCSAEVIAPTRVGIDPFDPDASGEYRCPLGDLIGLNLLSEVTVASGSRRYDVFCTHQFVGVRRGLLRPERIVLISPRVWRIIKAEKLSGTEAEVAHTANEVHNS